MRDDRLLTVSVSFDPVKGYTGTAPELNSCAYVLTRTIAYISVSSKRGGR